MEQGGGGGGGPPVMVLDTGRSWLRKSRLGRQRRGGMLRGPMSEHPRTVSDILVNRWRRQRLAPIWGRSGFYSPARRRFSRSTAERNGVFIAKPIGPNAYLLAAGSQFKEGVFSTVAQPSGAGSDRVFRRPPRLPYVAPTMYGLP